MRQYNKMLKKYKIKKFSQNKNKIKNEQNTDFFSLFSHSVTTTPYNFSIRGISVLKWVHPFPTLPHLSPQYTYNAPFYLQLNFCNRKYVAFNHLIYHLCNLLILNLLQKTDFSSFIKFSLSTSYKTYENYGEIILYKGRVFLRKLKKPGKRIVCLWSLLIESNKKHLPLFYHSILTIHPATG